jgi:hypothetical protein
MSNININDQLSFVNDSKTKHGLRGHIQVSGENIETSLWYEDDNCQLCADGISGVSSQSTMPSPMMTSVMSSTTDGVRESIIETPVVSTTPNLVFTDNYGTTFEHSSNPSSDETTTINLGAGLKIIL